MSTPHAMNKVKIGIVGGAGYTAGELLRLLIRHPHTIVHFAHSNSMAGQRADRVHQDLVGETELTFTDQLPFSEVDILFLCTGHGTSQAFLQQHDLPAKLKIIDLSQDFRITDGTHDFVYGLPELHKSQIKEARHVANPGCFATAIQLGLLPLAQAKLLKEDVHIHGITGSTGAGQQPTETVHFSWRNDNVSIYKAFRHQHLREIQQSVCELQSEYAGQLNFLPVRGNFTRGIFASLYTEVGESAETVEALYRQFYADAPFVTVADQNPHLKQVVNTNKAIIYAEKVDDKVLIMSMIDNLLKGASGQAVQNMNLMMGWEETVGLQLKANYF